MDAKELIGQANAQQPQLIGQFKQAVGSAQLAHAFLFTGPQGRGQMEVAKWLAMRLLCQNIVDGQPDGTCVQCQRIAKDEHPDVIMIAPDGKSIKVEQIRYLRDEFTKTAVEGSQKIFIITGADTMTTSAANGLLKFIEEPIGQQTAILMADNRNQILPTIISRTQVIDFPALGTEQLTTAMLTLGYTAQQAPLVQTLTDSTQTAADWLTDDWFSQIQAAVDELVTAMLQRKELAFTLVQTKLVPLATDSSRQPIILAMLAQAWRDIVLSKTAMITMRFASGELWRNEAQQYPIETVLAVLETILTAPQRLQKNINFQTTVEAAVLESQFKLAGDS